MKGRQMLVIQNELRCLYGIPLCFNGRSSETVGGQEHQKNGGAGVAAVLEEFSQGRALSNSIGVKSLHGGRGPKEQNGNHGKPGARGGVVVAIEIGQIPGMPQYQKASQSHHIRSDLVGNVLVGQVLEEGTAQVFRETLVLDFFAPLTECQFLVRSQEELQPSFRGPGNRVGAVGGSAMELDGHSLYVPIAIHLSKIKIKCVWYCKLRYNTNDKEL
jgi:hypothetical protein